MIRHVLSVVIALVASLAGLVMLWIGGAQVFTTVQQFVYGGPWGAPGGVVLASLGVLLLAVAGYSTRWSGLGAIVAGALHVLGGVLALLMPVSVNDTPAPIWNILFSLGDLSRELSDGAVIFTARGAGIVVGFLLIGAGLAALLRRPAGSLARILAAVLGALVLLVTVGLALAAGSQVYRSYFLYFSPDPAAAALLVLAGVAVGVAAFSLKWSSVGAIVAGGVLVVVGVVFALTVGRPAVLPPQATVDVVSMATLGILQAVGAVLIGAGLGIAARRAPARLAD